MRDTLAPADERLALGVDEVARLLGINRNTAYQLVAAGELPSIRLGRRIVVPKAALAHYLAGGATGEGARP